MTGFPKDFNREIYKIFIRKKKIDIGSLTGKGFFFSLDLNIFVGYSLKKGVNYV